MDAKPCIAALYMHLAMIILVHLCLTLLSRQKACIKLLSTHEKFSFFPPPPTLSVAIERLVAF